MSSAEFDIAIIGHESIDANRLPPYFFSGDDGEPRIIHVDSLEYSVNFYTDGSGAFTEDRTGVLFETPPARVTEVDAIIFAFFTNRPECLNTLITTYIPLLNEMNCKTKRYVIGLGTDELDVDGVITEYGLSGYWLCDPVSYSGFGDCITSIIRQSRCCIPHHYPDIFRD